MQRPKEPGWWCLPAVVLAAALTFAISVTFPFIGWDDPMYATNNPLVVHPLSQGFLRLLTTEPLGYPQPLAVLSYALNRLVFGMTPWSFHLVNVALHLINVALVGRLARAFGLSAREAAIAAMIFALHPLVVEPVCWISGRKDLLATAFLLAGITVMLRGAGSSPDGKDAPFPSAARWALVTLLCTIGMGAKPSAAVAAVVLAIVAYGARPGWALRRVALAVTPLAAIGAAVVAFAGRAQHLAGDAHARTMQEAALDVLGAWVLQLGHLIVPLDLVTHYERVSGDPSAAAMVLGACALVALVVVLVRIDKRSPIFAGSAFALVAFAPMSNVLAVNRWTADSYMYLSLVGIAIAVVAALRPLAARAERILPFVAVSLGVALAFDSFGHVSAWSAPDTVWLAVIARYPKSPIGYTTVASTYAWMGRKEDASHFYLELDTRFPNVEWSIEQRALARLDAGQPDRACTILERGIAEGDLPSAQQYWVALLTGQIKPQATDRTAVAKSFDMVRPALDGEMLARATLVRDQLVRKR